MPTVKVKGSSHFGTAKSRYYEDRIKVEAQVFTRGGLSFALGVVADGIGGENAGERAATLTVDKVFEYCQNSEDTDVLRTLEKALESANTEVFEEAQQQSAKKNMGSTAAVAAVHKNKLYIANVGDSRIYLIRNKQITQLTIDHTWEQEIVKAGKLSSSEAARHPRRGELTRSIGYEATVKVDLGVYIWGPNMSSDDAIAAQGLPLLPGDRVVICSDGLVKSIPNEDCHFVEPSEVVKIVTETSTDKAPEKLIALALERRVDDNVSTIVMEIPGGTHPFLLPQNRIFCAGAIAAVLLIGLLCLMIFSRLISIYSSLPSLPTITESQIYLAQIQDLKLTVFSSNNSSPQSIQPGSLVNFINSEVVQTTGSYGKGYAYLGLPGDGQLYLAGNTSIIFENLAQPQFGIMLNKGWVLVNKPSRKFLVNTPNGSQAWASSGAMMGLHYDTETLELYIDCLQGTCWIDSQRPLPTGLHAILKGTQIVSSGLGTRNDYWQFVPGLVPILTPTPASTLTRSPPSYDQSFSNGLSKGSRSSSTPILFPPMCPFH